MWKKLFIISNNILLVASTVYIVTYGTDLFLAWYSQVRYEQQAFKWRITGPYWWSYWVMIVASVLLPQILWFKKIKRSYKTSLILVPLFSIGFLFEQFVIFFISRYRDYLPSSWTYYSPAFIEYIIPFITFSTVLMLTYFIFGKRIREAG